jgi:hypothetical protein
MTSPMYTFAVPVFKQMLMALKAVLAQASTHATAHSIEPDALLQARLYPDMFALAKQVQIAADFARGISARATSEAFRPSMRWPRSASTLGARTGPAASCSRR